MVVLGGHSLLQLINLGEHVLWVIFLGTIALQDTDVEVSKLSVRKIQVGSAIRIGVAQVGTGPVQDRHEVITDGVDALSWEVAQAHLVILDKLVAVGASIFDAFRDRKTLNDTPPHTIALDIRFKVMDFLACPYFTVWDVVQGGNDALDTNLF